MPTNDPRLNRPTQLKLLKRLICPNCWSETTPDRVLWISEHADLLGDPRLGEEEQQRFLPTRFTVRGNALDARGGECHELACPHCHLRLPRDLLELRLFFMSIFGSPSSGKTVYLAALTHKLRQTMPLDFQISFQDTDPQDNVRIRRNESLLFDNPDPETPVILGDLISKTMQSGTERGISLLREVHFGGNDRRYFPQPFMFTLQMSDDHHANNSPAGFGRILCLYDNAGEAFSPSPEEARWELQTRHLSRSSLLLFTFDPTQDPRLQRLIRETSPDRLPSHLVQESQEPFFQEAAKRIKQFAGLSRRDRHKAPLIIVTTKFDCWSDLLESVDKTSVPWRHVRIGAGNGQKEQVTMAVDRPAIQEMSQQVKRLLLRTSPEIVSAAETLAEDVTYIPVSALGWNNAAIDLPDRQVGGYQIRPADTKPFWVEVPVIYGISRAIPGLIPVLKG